MSVFLSNTLTSIAAFVQVTLFPRLCLRLLSTVPAASFLCFLVYEEMIQRSSLVTFLWSLEVRNRCQGCASAAKHRLLWLDHDFKSVISNRCFNYSVVSPRSDPTLASYLKKKTKPNNLQALRDIQYLFDKQECLS